MSDDFSFDKLLQDLRTGDDDAAARIVSEYTQALVAVARRQIGPQLARRLDPEDVVQSTYRSLFVRLQGGEYELGNGSDFWKLLVTMTLNKVRRKAKYNSAGCRDMKLEHSVANDAGRQPVDHLAGGREPSPQDAAELVDEIQALLDSVGPRERPLIELRLQGLSTAEIANQTGRAERSVRRVLAHVKERLEQRIESA